MAYRGRVQLKIAFTPHATLPKPIVQDASPEDARFTANRLQDTVKEHKLFGIFFSANMIHPHDKLVEFEISIGKY